MSYSTGSEQTSNALIEIQTELIDFWHLRSTICAVERPHLKDCVGYFVCLSGGPSSGTISSSAAASRSQQEFSAEEIEDAEKRFNSLTSTLMQLERKYLPSDDRDRSMQATAQGSFSKATSAELQQKFVDTIEEGIDVSDKAKSDAYAYLGDLYSREKDFLHAAAAYEKSYKLGKESMNVDMIPHKLKMVAHTYFLHEDHEGLEYKQSIAYGDELLTECSTIFGLDSVEFAMAEVFVCGISKSARGLSMELSHLLSDATSTLVFKLGPDHELTKSAQLDLKAVRTLLQYQKGQEREKRARSALLPRLGIVYGYDLLTRNLEIKLNNTDMQLLQEIVSSGDDSRVGEIAFVEFELSYDHPKLEWYASEELRRKLSKFEKVDESEDGDDQGHVERLVHSLRTKRGGDRRASALNREGFLILSGGATDFGEDEPSSTKSNNTVGNVKTVGSPVFSLSSRSNHVHPAGESTSAKPPRDTRRVPIGIHKASVAGELDGEYGVETEAEEKQPNSVPRVRQNRMGIGRGRVGLDPFPASGESLIDQIRAREADKRRKRHEEEIRRAEETERERKRFEPLSLESWQSVGDWLRDRGEPEAAREVKNRKIAGHVLLKLDHRGWRELGVQSAADRAKLMMAVEDYYSRWDLKHGPGLVPIPSSSPLRARINSKLGHSDGDEDIDDEDHGGSAEGSASSWGVLVTRQVTSAMVSCFAFLCCAETEQPKVRSKLPEYDEKELTLDPRNPRDEELARMIEVADMADSPGFKTSRMNRGGNVLDDWDA